MIWHNSSIDDVINELTTNRESGLTADEVAARLATYGHNTTKNTERKNIFSVAVSKLFTFGNIALIIVSITYIILAAILEVENAVPAGVIIISAIMLNLIHAVIDFIMERMLFKYSGNSSFKTTVIRNGIEMRIDSGQLVPGDIMILNTGDYIMADGRLIDSYALTCEEFRVTGEIAPFEKKHDILFDDITPIEKRQNMVYSGSIVSGGRGIVVVTETGFNTELGMRKDISEQIDNKKTATEEKLDTFKKYATIAATVCSIVIFFCYVIINFSSKPSFAFTVTSGLLLALTVFVASDCGIIPSFLCSALAFSQKRMNEKGVLINNPALTEQLKDVSVICTDKTGSLTTEFLTVVKISNGKKIVDLRERDCDEGSQAILRMALICSNFSHDEHTERHTNNMERAIETACIAHTGMSKVDVDGIYPRLAEIPFSSDRMLMTTVTSAKSSPFAIIKGAPEVIASRCVEVEEGLIENTANEFAKEGLKVIAVALKQLDGIPANPTADELENGLTFVGLIGFEDEASPEAAELCRECAKAGIKVLMLTGDHFDTAVAVGKKLGIVNDASEAISGEQLAEFEDPELAEVIKNYTIFARISPEDKGRIVRALKTNGEKVAVTGDSINDAQALLDADFGCALGNTASDMVKDCADFVLSDNKFTTLVSAIKESSRVFANVKKSLKYFLAFELILVLTSLFGLLIFGIAPLSMSAMILLTALAVILPCIGFYAEDSEHELTLGQTDKSPYIKDMILGTAAPALFVSILTLIAFGAIAPLGQSVASAATFTIIAFSSVINALVLSHRKSIFSSNFLKSKTMPICCVIVISLICILALTPVSSIVALSGLNLTGWIFTLCSVVGVIILDETVKIISNKFFS